MKRFQKAAAICLSAMMFVQGGYAFAYDDLSVDTIRAKQLVFAAQYQYNEGDFDRSFALYPGITYSSGIEYRADGTAYECPAIYVDEHAICASSYSLEKGKAKFMINGTTDPYFDQCVLYNARLLIPVDAFMEVGCNVSTNLDTYVTTISKDGVILEILPGLIGMRKNQADGFYVPLEVCARIIDDTLYVPVRAVSNEFKLNVNWDGITNTVTLNE